MVDGQLVRVFGARGAIGTSRTPSAWEALHDGNIIGLCRFHVAIEQHSGVMALLRARSFMHGATGRREERLGSLGMGSEQFFQLFAGGWVWKEVEVGDEARAMVP